MLQPLCNKPHHVLPNLLPQIPLCHHQIVSPPGLSCSLVQSTLNTVFAGVLICAFDVCNTVCQTLHMCAAVFSHFQFNVFVQAQGAASRPVTPARRRPSPERLVLVRHPAMCLCHAGQLCYPDNPHYQPTTCCHTTCKQQLMLQPQSALSPPLCVSARPYLTFADPTGAHRGEGAST